MNKESYGFERTILIKSSIDVAVNNLRHVRNLKILEFNEDQFKAKAGGRFTYRFWGVLGKHGPERIPIDIKAKKISDGIEVTLAFSPGKPKLYKIFFEEKINTRIDDIIKSL